MLAELIAYARREGLAAEPGFAEKKARWALDFDESGAFAGVAALDPASPDKPAAVPLPGCPHLNTYEMKAVGPGWRHFAVDDLRGALGWDPSGDGAKAERHRVKFAAWLREAADAGAAPPRIAAAFESPASIAAIRAAVAAAPGKAKPTDLVALRTADGKFLHAGPAAVAWWRARYRRIVEARRGKSPAGVARPSLVDGSPVAAVKTHPMARGLGGLGARQTGAALASADKAAFQHYGLVQGEHHPVDADQAAGYVAAIEAMATTGRDFAGSRLATWSDAGGDPYARLFDPEAAAVREGTAYAFLFKGNQARVEVRSWEARPCAAVAKAVDEWLEDLAIDDAWSGDVARPADLHRLAAAITPERRARGPILEAIFAAASGGRGSPIPRVVVEAAAARQQTAFLRGDLVDVTSARMSREYDPEGPPACVADWILRTAVLGAAMRRNGGDEVPTPGLQEDHPSPYYQAGRLGALLFHARQIVDFSRNGGSIGRSHPSAADYSTLFRRSAQYMRALQSADQNRHRALVQLIGDVYRTFPGTPPLAIPGTVEAQALYGTGFYHQQATLPRAYGEPTRARNGVWARSKQEAALLDFTLGKLEGTDYTLDYEPRLAIPGTSASIRPDVRINRPGMRPIFIEHQGMLDIAGYRMRQNDKLSHYARLGVRPIGADGESANGVLLTTTPQDAADGFAAFDAQLTEALATA